MPRPARARVPVGAGVLFDLNRLIVNGSGLQVIEGTFINERGEITANAITAEGNTHAVVLIPCDESHPNRDGCDYLRCG